MTGLVEAVKNATPHVPEIAVLRPLEAAPFEFCDPSRLPPRPQIFRNHFFRRFCSLTVAPGGTGKSILEKVDCCSMVIGRDLFKRDHVFGESLRCWYLGLEDDLEESSRGFMAVCKRYDLQAADLRGLYVNSGRDRGLVIASETRDGVVVHVGDVEALKHELRSKKIDVMVVDPFVESHAVSESLNDHIKQVMAVWRQVANDCNVSIELVHHIRKNNGAETTIDDVRGASAMKDSAGSVRLLSSMSKEDAQAFGIPSADRRRYVSIASGKGNFTAPSDAREWFLLETVALDNATAEYPDGDRVGVPVAWSLPGPLAAIQPDDCIAIRALAAAQNDPAATARVSPQSAGWFGRLVAPELGLDPTDREDMKKVARLLVGLLKNKWLREGLADDSNRIARPVFLPGETGGGQ